MHRFAKPVAHLALALIAAFWASLAWADQNRTLLVPEQTLISLFEQSKDSVVAITTEARVLDPWRRQAQMVPQGSGSGFLWDADGHIVTNAHVIEGANAAEVHLSDGRVFPARLVGAAPRHDLAVLKIEIAEDPPAPLPAGQSETLRVGQSVLAIGNPFGLDWTLTTGIVSAMGREIPNGQGGRIEGLIQTDAAINPGNSGGPLIDSGGRLIGVNTAIFSPSGSSAGIGFAVPVDTVARVVPQLIETGFYRPPTLGVTFDPRIDALARQQGMSGVVILDVAPDSPAATAGLQRAMRAPGGTMRMGDVIVGLGGRAIDDSVDLQSALDAHAPGDRVTLELWNNGKVREIEVALAAPD